MDDLKVVSKYLASEVSKANVMNLEEIEGKIYAALAIVTPIESKRSKDISKLQTKIFEIRSRKGNSLKKKDEEIKFWKDKARSYMDNWQVKQAYEELDKRLKKNGF
jgi:hypothetical protein